MKKDIFYWMYIATLILLILSYAKITYNGIRDMGNKDAEEAEDTVVVVDTTDFLMRIGEEDIEEDTINEVLSFLDVEHPKVVFAQMRLESGNFKSSLSQTNNNFFGMRHPYRRDTHSLGSINGYASYANWAFSIADYALWQRRYASGLSEEEYLEKLGRVYATDKKYRDKISNIMREI